MTLKDFDLEDEYENEPQTGDRARQQSAPKDYRAKRSAKATRRRIPKASHPGHGISARRQRRWSW